MSTPNTVQWDRGGGGRQGSHEGPKRAVAAVGSTFGTVKILVENLVFYSKNFHFFLSSDPGVGFRDRIQESDSGVKLSHMEGSWIS